MRLEPQQLTPDQLDWCVAKSLGFEIEFGFGDNNSMCARDHEHFGHWGWNRFSPTTNIADAWPLIEQAGITLGPHDTSPAIAWVKGCDKFVGPTLLVAAMRSWVDMRMLVRDEFKLPKELL